MNQLTRATILGTIAQIAIALVAFPRITNVDSDGRIRGIACIGRHVLGQHGRGHKQTRKNRNTGLRQQAL